MSLQWPPAGSNHEAGEKGELFKDGVPTELVGKVFYILGEPGLEIDSSDIDETMKTKIAAHHLNPKPDYQRHHPER